MVDLNAVRALALAFEDAEEHPHFENQSFRIKKKIFATLNAKMNRACLKLPLIDQSVFCEMNDAVIYPVPNKWGKQGWTLVELKKVRKNVFKDALTTAYCHVAPKKLAQKYQPNA